MDIHRATINDISTMLIIEQATDINPWSYNILSSCFDDSNYRVYIGRLDNAIMSYVVIFDNSQDIELLKIAVEPSYQRQGYGQQLFQFILDLTSSRHIILEVRASNTKAIHFYQKNGFTAIARRKNYYKTPSQNKEDALILSKR